MNHPVARGAVSAGPDVVATPLGPGPVTLGELCRAAPAALVPVAPAEPASATVTATHISELVDPTPYLQGGELLLTTGLALPTSPPGCRAYVLRLRGRGVAGLAFGLGPVHQEIPAVLRRACVRHELPLLGVPVEASFQIVTRAFWALTRQTEQRHLHEALDSHRRLVDAGTAANPVPTVLTVLGEAVGGWAAVLDPRGHPVACHPPHLAGRAARLATEVVRLRPAGPHSSATFPVGGQVGVLHPIVADREVVGYLAMVAGGPMTPPHRGLLLTALALLGLDAVHRRAGRHGQRVGRAAVAHLIESGHLALARSMATTVAVPAPPGRCRLVVAEAGPGDDVLAAVLEALPEHDGRWWGTGGDSTAWLLLHPGVTEPDPTDVARRLRDIGSPARVFIGPVIDLGDLGPALAGAQARLVGSTEAVSTWRVEPAGPQVSSAWAQATLAGLRGGGTELLATVAGYLRHRGGWEATATELGVHRNSVRARVARAQTLLGADLDDPDVASRIWLALRATGIA